MTELPIGFMTKNNPCYIYYLRLQDCVHRESMYKLMCTEQFDDYSECKTQRRHKGFRVWFNYESRRMKILSLPMYDDRTDSFVDGPLPHSVDSIFNSESSKEFFENKKYVPTNTEGGHH